MPRRSAPAYRTRSRTAMPAERAARRALRRRPSREANLGGGFIEFLFGGGRPVRAAAAAGRDRDARTAYAQPDAQPEPRRAMPDPKFLKQVVAYSGPRKPGTIIIDTPQRFLYLVQDNGTAMRYGIGVGRPGFTWAGVKQITRQEGMAGLDAAAGDAAAASRSAAAAWRAARKIRSARAPCISAPRSIASTARTSPGPSARRCRPAASACATRTSIDLYERVKVGTKVMVI